MQDDLEQIAQIDSTTEAKSVTTEKMKEDGETINKIETV